MTASPDHHTRHNSGNRDRIPTGGQMNYKERVLDIPRERDGEYYTTDVSAGEVKTNAAEIAAEADKEIAQLKAQVRLLKAAITAAIPLIKELAKEERTWQDDGNFSRPCYYELADAGDALVLLLENFVKTQSSH